MVNKNRNLDEQGDNLLNPNVSVNRDECPSCKETFENIKYLMQQIPDLMDIGRYKEDRELHCMYGHNMDEQRVKKVLGID